MVHGIARYRQARASVPPEQLLLLLLREAVTRIARVEQLPPDDPAWITDLHHVRAIVMELRGALDPSAAPELVQTLHSLYSWSLEELLHAGNARDPKVLHPIRKTLTSLLEGCQEAFTDPPRAA